MSRIALETEARAGTVTLVNGYRSESGVKLGLCARNKPAKITPPCAFVDSVAEDTEAFTVRESQRTVRIGLRLVWGVYDYGQTVDQRDRFVDGFYAYVMDNGDHAFGPNTLCSWVNVSDDEQWSPSWIDTPQDPLFSTLITLEGFAST